MNEALPTAVQISDTVIYQKLREEVVLLNMDSQRYFGLDEVGGHMWESLVKHGNIEAAAAAIEGDYQVDPGVLRQDLEALVRDLLAAGLLKSVP